MEVKAQLNGLRIAPRKVRLVVGLVKKKDVDTALDQLAHLTNRASRPVSKTISSAIANAENNHRMVRGNLYVKNAWVDEGTKLRRWRPKGFGRAGTIQKKTSHINIVLDERVAGMRAAEQTPKKPVQADSDEPAVAPAEQAPEAAATEDVKTIEKPKAPKVVQETPKPTGKGLKGFGKRLFRRKSI